MGPKVPIQVHHEKPTILHVKRTVLFNVLIKLTLLGGDLTLSNHHVINLV